ncbi:helix-turn-helix domain-containing protein [Streptomyces sp. NBC_00306]|uniref:helix-turn-helix domain-containing protein n=1 Tax=Streptomyces sp. NBC_00306 TaxID=2975708 RepID=UPI002E29E07C|nr:helix-turn-helix domain-containing protein [Streptomyces sp. NBC_00306]
MDTQQVSAPSRASSRVPGRVTAFGVIHVNAVHTSRFTIVGNHLAQHGELSLTAIGLAVHFQSLPDGAKIGIQVLAERFPESEERIAAALRELEEHAYLERRRERVPGGKVVTRTISYNRPSAVPKPSGKPEPQVAPGRPAVAALPLPAPKPSPAPAPAQPPTRPDAPLTPPPRPRTGTPAPPPPLLPQPQVPDLERQRVATDLLAGLRRDEPRLLLAERDISSLAPAVAAWLERDTHPDDLRRTLAADLPEPLRHPAGLLAHRLTVLLPPPLPAAPPGAMARDPLQNCDRCDRAFRAPVPGCCRGCRTDTRAAA